jgi:hypothetical protein
MHPLRQTTRRRRFDSTHAPHTGTDDVCCRLDATHTRARRQTRRRRVDLTSHWTVTIDHNEDRSVATKGIQLQLCLVAHLGKETLVACDVEVCTARDFIVGDALSRFDVAQDPCIWSGRHLDATAATAGVLPPPSPPSFACSHGMRPPSPPPPPPPNLAHRCGARLPSPPRVLQSHSLLGPLHILYC